MISGRVKMVEERKTGPDDYRDGARVPRWWLYSISIIYNQVVMKWWWVAKPGNHRSTTTDGEIDKHTSRFCCRWRRCGFHHNERVRRPQTNNFQNEGKRIKKEEEVVFSAAIICVCVVVAVSFFFGWLAGSMFLFFLFRCGVGRRSVVGGRRRRMRESFTSSSSFERNSSSSSSSYSWYADALEMMET